MNLVYRNKAGGQPWANRLAEGFLLVYVLKLRDRCRSGLSGSPGKRVLGKTNRGFESLPVRPYYVPQSRDFEGLGGQGYFLTQRSPRAAGNQSRPQMQIPAIRPR